MSLASPRVKWKVHKSARALFEHQRLLPRLHSVVAEDAVVPLGASYAVQRARRKRGGTFAHWQMAESGALTLPHVDDDLQGTGLATYIVVVEGAELIVAWRRDDLHEDDVLRHIHGPIPSLDVLMSSTSLTVLRAIQGDMIYMPRDAVHMVVTEKRKIHLAFHMYEAGGGRNVV